MAHEQTVKQFHTTTDQEIWAENKAVIAHSGALHATRHIVDILTAALLILLSLRFMFEIFASDRLSRFSQLVYAITEPLVVPFAGLLPNISLGVNGGRIDAAIVAGMISIAFISYAIQQLLIALQPVEESNT